MVSLYRYTPVPMITVAFAMHKGGVTKTVSAAHAAVYLARRGSRVLAIDLDSQANLTSYLLSEEAYDALDVDLENVLINDQAITEVIVPTLHERLDLGPSSPNMAEVPKGLVMRRAREDALARALKRIDDKYDYCVLDCPPAADLMVENALAAADWLVMPLECGNFCLSGLSEFFQWVESCRDIHDARWLGVVLSKVDRNTRIYQAMMAQIEASPFELLAEVPKRIGVEDLVGARHVASPTLMADIAGPYEQMVDRIVTKATANG